jgi:hypothetical protein
MGQFVAHGLRRKHALEQFAQQPNIAGQHQIVQRARIGDDEQPDTPSEAEPLQVAAVALQILRRVGAENSVRGQKFIELAARGEAEQLTQFGPAEMPLPELIERQRFEYAALDLAPGAKAPGEIVGDADGDFRVGGAGAVVHIFLHAVVPGEEQQA